MNLRDLQALTARQWAERANSALPYAVSAGLVIGIAWQLVQVTWLLLDRNRSVTPAAAIVARTPRQKAPTSAAVDVQAIANAHIFDVAAVTQTMNPMDAPPAQVNLVLAGTMASDPPDQAGFAIIGETPTNAKTYSVGATIQPGIRLHAVYADRAIIDRGGSLETLKLPRQYTGPMPVAAAPLPSAAPAPNNFAQNLRRLAESNPSAFSEVVRPQPVFANGSLRGYRVYPGRNRKPFAKLGLQPGDLVTSINGTPLDDPARGMEIFNSIASSPRVEVTVERNGQSQQVVLDTAKINLPDTDGAGGGAPSTPAGGKPPASAPPDTSRSVAGIESE